MTCTATFRVTSSIRNASPSALRISLCTCRWVAALGGVPREVGLVRVSDISRWMCAGVSRSRRHRCAAPRRRFPRRAQPWWPARADAPASRSSTQDQQGPVSMRRFAAPRPARLRLSGSRAAASMTPSERRTRPDLRPAIDPAARSHGFWRPRAGRAGLFAGNICRQPGGQRARGLIPLVRLFSSSPYNSPSHRHNE